MKRKRVLYRRVSLQDKTSKVALQKVSRKIILGGNINAFKKQVKTMDKMREKNENLNVVISPGKTEKLGKKKSFWHINREMLPYKLHFLLFVGGAGAIFPFQSAFGITVLGLTASNVAASFTALQVTVFLLKPTIGYIADYFNRLKLVMMGLAVLQVIFALLLINIPNTGMPGIHTTEFTNTSQNNTYCQFCFNSDTFELLHPKSYLDEEKFKQVSFCFSNNAIQTTLINCPSKYIKSINFTNDSFKVTQTTCKLSYTDNILSENDTGLEGVWATEDDLDILFIKTSQISSLCLLPIGSMFRNINFSSEYLNKYCYSLSNESYLQLKQIDPKSDFITKDCKDPNKRTFSEQVDEHSIGVANFKTYQFWAYALCLVICCTVGSSEFTMSDTACYESIQGNDYGHQRVWGAISWGLMAPFAGFLNDYTESYMASWYIAAGFTVLQIWNLSRMNLIKPDFSQNILKDMKTIFSSMEFLFFEVGVLLNGMFTGIIWYYLTWFIISIGGNKLIIGLVHTMQCFFGEVPAMYFSGWLIKKLGHFNLVSLALISHGIRFFCYSYLHNPWWILPIECLHGLTFGSFYAAMTSYGKLNSKPGTEATTQSILCTTYEALGCGLGCLVTGVCLEYFGGHATFFYASFVCVIATVINVVCSFIVRCRKGSQDVTKSVTSTERY